MQMYRFAHPEYLYALFGLVPVCLAMVLYVVWQNKARKRFGDAFLLNEMAPRIPRARKWFKWFFWMLGYAFLVIALANPQTGSRLEKITREGLDLIFAVDVSKSMLVEDVQPSRLARAHNFVGQSLGKLAGDRVAVVAYAGEAFQLMPLTTDYSAVRLLLKNAHPDMVSSQGTALDAALEIALETFEEHSTTKRVVVIVSDGEDHEENWNPFIQKLNDAAITVFTVGIGTEKGGPIPVSKQYGRVSYKRDAIDEVVISRRVTSTLSEIASKTGGKYFDGNSTRQSVLDLTEALKQYDRDAIEESVMTAYDDHFVPFLAAGFACFLLTFVMADKRSNWMERLGIQKSGQ